ncbi:hypothetical protein [Candidatus Nitrosocosmicus hydrocola]|uniref:hypothetical protein n=1 Tax=Candidatus Nitrosocosmicus hydrocola TaxID=1826872 RepID=UPI0011E5EEB1|nr:hypothetical protein [Candidatus Nitrosocosmicus hydrocola]
MTKSTIVRESVINGYLNGKSFDEISYENNIAKGSVFNIVNSWITHIGVPDIKELREFSIMVRKSGITIKQCAQGFRFIQILANFGIKDELDDDIKYTTGSISGNTGKNDRNYPTSRQNFYDFVENIYNYCKNTGIESTNLIEWMQDLINFSSLFSEYEGNNISEFKGEVNQPDNINKKHLYTEARNKIENNLPLVSEISDYIEQRKLKAQHLHTTNKKLQREVDSLEEQKNAVLARITNLKERENKALTYLDWYHGLKNDLWNSHGIRIEQEVDSFVKTLNDFRFYNYKTQEIVKEYKQFEALRNEIKALQGIVGSIKKTRDDTLQELKSLEERENYSRQALDTILELNYSGFGFKELKQLNNTIMEIAVSNDISTFTAVQRFFKDVENQYDNKLGFETKINEIKTEMKKLEDEMPGYKEYLQLKVFMISSLLYLHKSGVTDDDIISMTHIVTAYLNGNISFDPNLSSKSIIDENKLIRKAHYWKLFIDEIRNLGDINSQIHKQGSALDTIKREIDDLNSQRQKLNEQTLLSAQLLNALNAKLSSFIEFTKEAISSIKDKNKIFIVYQPLFIINVITRGDPKNDDNNLNDDKSP